MTRKPTLADQVKALHERLDAIVKLCDAGDRDGWHAARGRAIRAIAKGSDGTQAGSA